VHRVSPGGGDRQQMMSTATHRAAQARPSAPCAPVSPRADAHRQGDPVKALAAEPAVPRQDQLVGRDDLERASSTSSPRRLPKSWTSGSPTQACTTRGGWIVACGRFPRRRCSMTGEPSGSCTRLTKGS